MAAGEVFGVPLGEDGFPVFEAADLRVGFAEGKMLWVEGGVFDAELSHFGTCPLLAIEFHRQAEMFQDDFSLLVERWRGRQRLARGERAGLLENPRVADGSASDCHAVDSSLPYHVEAGLSREQVSAAEDRAAADVLFHFRQKAPAAGADVPLFDGTAMNGDGGNAGGERPVENLEKPVAALLRVVDAAAHLDRDRNLCRDAFPRQADDLKRDLRLAEV